MPLGALHCNRISKESLTRSYTTLTIRNCFCNEAIGSVLEHMIKSVGSRAVSLTASSLAAPMKEKKIHRYTKLPIKTLSLARPYTSG